MDGFLKISGGRKLSGKVRISGAKNSALQLIPAALLTREPVTLLNIPDLSDIATMADIAASLGAKIDWDKTAETMRIEAPKITAVKVQYGLISKMRAGIYALGALLGRTGEAKVAAPGGCKIGARPIDFHLRAMEALGANIEIHHGYIAAKAAGGRMAGGEIDGLIRMIDDIPVTSHGGTVNTILAAALAKGETVMRHASMEPETDDLIAMLNKMGAKIRRETDDEASTLRITGVGELSGCEHAVMPDRLEAGTFAIAAGITGSRIEIDAADPLKMDVVLDHMRRAGIKIDGTKNGFSVDARGIRPAATDVSVLPYPGFPTDLQPQFMAMMAVAEGISTVVETMFENRLMYVPELVRMGASIDVLGYDSALFTGVEKLCAADVSCPDIRGGAALALAALAAEGETVLYGAHHIRRGYHDFAGKMRSLGAAIETGGQ
ncbi:MAG: UDP-N-acetylglucosamine 1-carboxyvinyltransferase [Rickettsiales bacterium]|jgi:UDP-N-acetylglucosamine 1-carboxyvinyltransferase|nr:UDP-N-acetylglucosamine 1-carboxyvinyltransferase [Rickettsiales bacterium]